MSEKNEIIEYARETYSKIESHRKIPSVIEAVKAKFDVTVSRKFIRYWCETKADELSKSVDESLHRLDDALEEKRSYEVEGESVTFHIDKKRPDGTKYTEKYAIPFDELKEIWYDYSSHGGNMSAKNVLIKHELKRETLALLRSRLDLTKDDNVIPQVILDYLQENFGEEAVEKEIVEVTHRAYSDKFKKKFVQADKREVDKLVRIGKDFETRLELVTEALKGYEPVKLDFVPENKDLSNETLNVFISDIHFGNGNDEDIKKRFDKLFKYVVAQPHKNVNLMVLGDLGENFAPNGMHNGQIKHMSMHGRSLTLFICNVLEEFLIGLYKAGKVIKFHGKGGNHDRVSEKHGEDDEKTMAWVIYELIKRKLENLDIGISYYMEDITTITEGNLHFILHHGDNGFAKRKPEDIFWKNGDNKKYNCAINGDLHHFNSVETKYGMKIQVPAMAGSGTYDTMLDLHSEPGVVIITENEEGTADVMLKRL